MPGGEDGGGAVIERGAVGCGGFAQNGDVAAGAAAGCLDEDLEAREVFGRAVVAEVGNEPALGGFVIDGAEELAEALGTWVGVSHNVRECCTGDASAVFEVASGYARTLTVITNYDCKVTHWN